MIKDEHNHTNTFSLESAISYAEQGRIEEWVHKFLLGEGNNLGLSEGIKKVKRYWHGPAEIAVSKLHRTAGPEPDMPYRSKSEEAWQERIGGIQTHLKNGGSLPPLIAEYLDGKLILRDGNHRQGALSQRGHNTCWTIIWFNSLEDEVKFKEGLAN